MNKMFNEHLSSMNINVHIRNQYSCWVRTKNKEKTFNYKKKKKNWNIINNEFLVGLTKTLIR